MSKPLSIFAICGEFSGESHLARVVSKLKEFSAYIQITGMGSSLTEKAGMENFIDYKDYSFAGVVDVILNLTKIFKLKKIILEKIIALKPDIVLMVDYAGFNMQIAKGIRAAQLEDSSLQNIKLVQYIAPQLWASRPHRIKNIKKNIDLVLYTLPFEKEIYESVQQPATYVGNPVLESLIEESAAECKAEIIDCLKYSKIIFSICFQLKQRRQWILSSFKNFNLFLHDWFVGFIYTYGNSTHCLIIWIDCSIIASCKYKTNGYC
jgi:lipid-A-disaccharide synthase